MLAKKSLAGESCFLLIHIIQHYKKFLFSFEPAEEIKIEPRTSLILSAL